jgi:hypothetical protein
MQFTAGHGLLRSPSGTITTVDYPGAVTTVISNLSASGRITGLHIDQNGAHGFIGLPGNLTGFDVPGAGTGFMHGTFPVYNDSADRVVGRWVDSNKLAHGFLRMP